MNENIRKMYIDSIKELRSNLTIKLNYELKKEFVEKSTLLKEAMHKLKKCSVYDEEDEENIRNFLDELIFQLLSDVRKDDDELFYYCLDSVYGERAFNDLSEEYISKYKYDHCNETLEDDYADEYSDDATVSHNYDRKERNYSFFSLAEDSKSPNKRGEYKKSICLLLDI